MSKGAYWSNNTWVEMGQLPAGTQALEGPGVAADSNNNVWIAYLKSNGSQTTLYVKLLMFSLFWQPEVAIAGSTGTGQPSMVLYRNRLHVAVARAFNPDVQELWYASCAMPCTAPDDFTRWVWQDGTTGRDVSLATGGAETTLLYMLHSSQYGSADMEWRSKDSE